MGLTDSRMSDQEVKGRESLFQFLRPHIQLAFLIGWLLGLVVGIAVAR